MKVKNTGDTRYFDERTKMTVKCKCGCSTAIPSYYKASRCRWCGRTVFRDKKYEFECKLKQQIIKNK